MSETFETADDVFTAAQIEYGEAIANLILNPSNAAKDELRVTGRALGEAARFAAKNMRGGESKGDTLMTLADGGSNPTPRPNLTNQPTKEI